MSCTLCLFMETTSMHSEYLAMFNFFLLHLSSFLSFYFQILHFYQKFHLYSHLKNLIAHDLKYYYYYFLFQDYLFLDLHLLNQYQQFIIIFTRYNNYRENHFKISINSYLNYLYHQHLFVNYIIDQYSILKFI